MYNRENNTIVLTPYVYCVYSNNGIASTHHTDHHSVVARKDLQPMQGSGVSPAGDYGAVG